MPAPGWLSVGRVAAPFGLRGEVRVHVFTEFPEHLSGRPLFLGDDRHPVTVTNVRFHQHDALLTIKGVDSVEAAEALRGQELSIAAADAVPLPEGRYYIHQIVGLAVHTTTGEQYGVVRDVLSRPANDVYVVEHEGRDVLVPAIADVVKEVDVAGGRMVIEVIPGLE